MTTHTLKEADLAQFTSQETWYKYSGTTRFFYTEGVRFIAETGGLRCVLDQIVLLQSKAAIEAQAFQLWTLTTPAGSPTTLFCQDINDKTLFSTDYHFSDSPQFAIRFVVKDNMILLSSEF